jgi:hypothetical protein
MNAGERHLVSLAAALMGDAAGLSAAEIKFLARAHTVDPHFVARARRPSQA